MVMSVTLSFILYTFIRQSYIYIYIYIYYMVMSVTLSFILYTFIKQSYIYIYILHGDVCDPEFHTLHIH